MFTLSDAQKLIGRYAPNPYYQDAYRGFELRYLPDLCRMVADVRAGWPDIGPPSTLDIGPGWGTMMAWLATNGWYVTVIDEKPLGYYITAELLRQLDNEHDYADYVPDYIQHNIENAPLPNQQFDLVLMTSVIPHLIWRPDRTIRHVAAMTRDTFICSLHDKRMAPRARYPYSHWRDVPEHQTAPASTESITCMYDEAELRDLLETGFAEVTITKPGELVLFATCRSPLPSAVP